MLNVEDRAALIARLDEARRERRATSLPRAAHPELTLADAYGVQHAWASYRMAEEGRTLAGYKVALTTRGSQQPLGAEGPIFGTLLDDMAFGQDAPVEMDRFLAPKVEMELAFKLGSRLAGPCSEAQAIAAIEWVSPAVEILDSRLVMRQPDSGLARSAIDIVADGGGAAGFAISDQRWRPDEIALSEIGAVLYHNGEAEDSGLFPLVFGRPERALVWLAAALADQHKALEPGDIVLSGSVIKPFSVTRGDRFEFDFREAGRIELAFV